MRGDSVADALRCLCHDLAILFGVLAFVFGALTWLI